MTHESGSDPRKGPVRPDLVPQVDIHDPDFVRDPWPTYQRLQRGAGLARGDDYGGYWLLVRHDDVRSAALDWRRFTSAVPGVTAIPVITPRTTPQLPIEVDPPAHSHYRALLAPIVSRPRLDALAPRIDAVVDRAWSAMLANGGGDCIADFAVPVSIQTLAMLMGLPDSDGDSWYGWIRAMFDVTARAKGAVAAAEFGTYIDGLIADRRARRTDDVISHLAHATLDGAPLSDEEVHSFIAVLFGAGFETTADGLGLLFWELIQNPWLLDHVRSRPDRLPLACEEVLRLQSPIQIFGRNAVTDDAIHGQPIERGDIVALGFGAANRDERVFSEPDRFDPDRTPNRHLAFGAGVHHCLGAPVARLEMVSALRAVATTGRRMGLRAGGRVEWKARGDRRGLSVFEVAVD